MALLLDSQRDAGLQTAEKIRAVLEQTDYEQDRELAGTALTQCAVMAALWRQVLGGWPVTKAFPGGSE